MPYLLGAFGANCTSDQIKKLSNIAQQQTADGTLQTMSIENGIIFAGYKRDEKYHFDNIIQMPDSNGIPENHDILNQGILVGKIFDRSSYDQVTFDREISSKIVHHPEEICKSFWGRYVGAFFDKATKTVKLIRDPQGLSTLFYTVKPASDQTNNIIIFATEIAILYQALEIKPAIDLNYFGQHLVHTNHALASTPFEGVKELLPGMGLSMNLSGQCSHDLLWDVSKFQGSFITDENSFEEELLATLKSCTKAWVGDASGVCVELSGGTDSSGLMLLLHDILPTNKKLMAVNYIDTKTQSSNEIEYAQEIADACNAPLYFLDWQNTSLLDKLPSDFFPNRPTTLLLFSNLRKQLYELARQNNCSEMMNGQGGDHIFLAPPPKHALADYWLERGISGITNPLNALSGVYRMPWLPLIHDNAKAVTNYYRKLRTVKTEATPFLDKNFARELKQEDLYLNNILRKMHPGKAGQIESLCHAVSYSERNQSMPNICNTHPLLSQPIIELGLRIPTYQSFYDGYDRIFFRRAVSRLKKTKSLWRRIKGQTTGSMVKQCAFHTQNISDIILNGKIVSSGMVNKQWLEEQLVKMQHGQVENLWPILHILTGQLWLNQWHL